VVPGVDSLLGVRPAYGFRECAKIRKGHGRFNAALVQCPLEQLATAPRRIRRSLEWGFWCGLRVLVGLGGPAVVLKTDMIPLFEDHSLVDQKRVLGSV
jgi:hypothetical protein